MNENRNAAPGGMKPVNVSEWLQKRLTPAKDTKYPKIFIKTYWGTSSFYSPDVPDTIIDNRNKFVEEFGVVKTYEPNSLWRAVDAIPESYPLIDHRETYLGRDKTVIVIFSSYSGITNLPASMTCRGFSVYAPLYSTKTVTYLAKYASLKEAVRVLKYGK